MRSADVRSFSVPSAKWRTIGVLALASSIVGILCLLVFAVALLAGVSEINRALVMAIPLSAVLALVLGGLSASLGERRGRHIASARIAFWLGAGVLCGLVVTFFLSMLWATSGAWGGP